MPESIPIISCYPYRAALGLSQRTVAQRAGICTGTYGKIEAGRGNPTLETLRRLAQVFHISQAELRGEGG